MEAENEAVDVESVDDTRPASTLLESSSSDDASLWKKTPKRPHDHHKEIEIPEGLDPESEKLIKEMLREERKYLLGKKLWKPPPWTTATSAPKMTDNKVSHHQRWTDRERGLFFEALTKYGHRWKKISEIIGTRTPQQVKSFSRYLSQKTLNQNESNKRTMQSPQRGNSSSLSSGEEVKLKTGTESDEGEEIDVLNDSGDEVDLASEVTSRLQANRFTTGQLSLKENLLDSVEDGIVEENVVGLDGDYTFGPDENVEYVAKVLTNSLAGSTLNVTENAARPNTAENDRVHNLSDMNDMGDGEAEELAVEEKLTRVHTEPADSLKLTESRCPLAEGSERLPESTLHDEAVLTDRHHGTKSDTSYGMEGKESDRLIVKLDQSASGSLQYGCLVGDASSKAQPAPFTVCVQQSPQSEGEHCNKTDSMFSHTHGKFAECDNEIACSFDPESRQPESCSKLVDAESEERGSLGPHGDRSSSGQEGLGVNKKSCDVDRTESASSSVSDLSGCSGTADGPFVIKVEGEGTPVQDDYKLSMLSEKEKDLNEEDLSTPDRATKYLRIRNFFVNLWETRKPAYVSKTQIRSVFKKFGDTHTIARIHHNLEKLGLINVGVANPCRRKYTTKKQKLQECKPDQTTTDDEVSTRKSQRPRISTNWRGFDEEEYAPQPKKKKKKSKRVAKMEYDPFKLIECSQFTEENPAPFSVSMEADALALMDLHAHLSSAEVIGLLGGQYQAEHNRLCIKVATPCKSLSTGMQCEMDPVSQTVACDSIMSAGLRVVGWYHSHPAFLPNPSIRDIETQAEFQGWFSQDGAPFIGVIVSPYQRIEESASMINCLTVRQGDAATDQEKYQPYGFKFTTCRDNVDLAKFIRNAEETLKIGQNYHLKIDMDAFYIRDQTYLEKTIASVCCHYADDDNKKFVRSRLTALLVKAVGTPENDPGSLDREDSTDYDHG